MDVLKLDLWVIAGLFVVALGLTLAKACGWVGFSAWWLMVPWLAFAVPAAATAGLFFMLANMWQRD